ncbi:redoxin domain-containing protein [Lacimicrobium alkaliphilum]|uniref:Alkyl hydroperoxide reductase n=1 Tax=Lacimicrobium alkaliphilum TaxID=1526571 RepID=A0A0U2RNI0_9ALTE|nr:redoxin domain-containing protein [Lacimicrobium alkaliphilum]ALS98890.1 alkyl hydroperoxide reductase [Lacimicrobium alkaliphilum]
MNNVFRLLSAGLFAGLLSSHALAAKVDEKAPDFTLTNTKGEQISLQDYAGKHVVLEWTNHLCPYVQKHYGSDNMQSLQKNYTGQDVIWLSVISSAEGKQGHVSAAEADALSESRSAHPTHVLFDPSGKVGKDYGAKTTPHMYVIDTQGVLRYNGAIDSIKSANPADIDKAKPYFQQAMDAVLKGEEVASKMTVPYGCSVKYAG